MLNTKLSLSQVIISATAMYYENIPLLCPQPYAKGFLFLIRSVAKIENCRYFLN